MKTRLFLLGLALSLSACAPNRVPVPDADNSSSTAIFNDVNRYRARLGKPPLVRHAGLDRLAREHSEYMMRNRGKFKQSKSGNLSHEGFATRAAVARDQYGMYRLHENIAAGPRGTSLTRSWAESRGHEPAMRGNWNHTGVGVAVDSDGMVFATQLFGS